MPTILDEILTTTRNALPQLRGRRAALEREAQAVPEPRSLSRALRRDAVAVIAEVKRRSPSAGTIRADLDPVATAAAYARVGASAISVITDAPYFGGSIDDLRAAAQVAPVPLIRKDFILEDVQILEARAAGAAAVLLIVRALGAARLRELLGAVEAFGLEALVEVHGVAELQIALDAGARIIGVNSRDLDTFQIDTAAAWDLVASIPSDRIAVAESGMATPADVEAAGARGADAVLIGTALSASPAPEALLAELARIPRRAR